MKQLTVIAIISSNYYAITNLIFKISFNRTLLKNCNKCFQYFLTTYLMDSNLKSIIMKKILFFSISYLFLCTNIITSQVNESSDVNEKQILKTLYLCSEKSANTGKLNDMKYFYPNRGVLSSLDKIKIKELSQDELIKDWYSQFNNCDSISYNILSNPNIKIAENGNTALVYSTIEIECHNLDKNERLSISGFSALVKEQGKWVAICETSELLKEKADNLFLKDACLQQLILGEF